MSYLKRKKRYDYTTIRGKRLLYGDSHEVEGVAIACLPKEVCVTLPTFHGKPYKPKHRLYPLSFDVSVAGLVVAKWTDGWGKEHKRFVEHPEGKNFWLLASTI